MRWLKGNESDEDGPDDTSQAEDTAPTPVGNDTGPDTRSPSSEGGTPSPWDADEDGAAPHLSAEAPDVPLDLADLSSEDIDRAVRRAVARALAEDLGDRGDVTAAATVPAGTTGTARVVARQRGVVSGLDAVVAVFAQVDVRVEVELHVADGEDVRADTRLATVNGPLRSVLTGERAALNLLGHLSGVATRTRAFVDAVDGTGAAIRDTRKTTPGLRVLEKRAVRHGGGHNHRLGLSDGLLVKDNHIAAAGSVAAAVERALERADGRHVQIEVTSLAQLEEALRAGAVDVLLDNMSPDEVRRAVARARGRANLEASGGIDLDTARSYAATGVHRLAVGSLTHSAPWMDVALDVVTEGLERPEWPLHDVWSDETHDLGAQESEPPDVVEGEGPFGHEDAIPSERGAADRSTAPPQAPAGDEQVTADGSAGPGTDPETEDDEQPEDDGSAGLFAWRERQQGG